MSIDEQVDIIAKLELIAGGDVDVNATFHYDMKRDMELSKTTVSATLLARALQYHLEILWEIPRPMVKDRILEIEEGN